MLLKFFLYTILSGLIIIFCILNQQVIPLDLYWVRVLAPMHFWLIAFFFLGVTFEGLRSMLNRMHHYLFRKKGS